MNTEKMDECKIWSEINWKIVERKIFKLQKRIGSSGFCVEGRRIGVWKE